MRDQAVSRTWSSTPESRTTVMGVAATAPLHIAAQRKINSYRQQYADNQNISVLPTILSTSTRMHGEFLRRFFLQAKPRDRGALQCHWTAIAKPPIGQRLPVQARGILPVVEEQSRPRGGKSGGVADQPQCRGVCHSSRPWACSFTRSPSSPPPPFIQSPFPPRSLVRDGQTSPHRPRLVVSRSTYSRVCACEFVTITRNLNWMSTSIAPRAATRQASSLGYRLHRGPRG